MIELIRKNKWPLVIFLAAFLVRLVYLLQYRSNPAFNFPMVDEQWHLNWAREILSGSFWGHEAYFRGPLYPYFLALLLKISGSSIFWTRLLQSIVPSLSAVLIFFIGNRLFSRKVGVLAALGFAFYGTMIFYDTMFLIEVLFVLLVLLAVNWLLHIRAHPVGKTLFGAGLIFGLAAIARPNILLLAPIFLIWIYFQLPSLKVVSKKLMRVAIYLFGILIPILSVTLRNYIVTGEAILISSQGGVNFYIGNNRDAEGLTMLMPEVRLDESLPWTQFTAATRQAAEKEVGRPLTAGQESSFWASKAMNFITENPGKFLGLTFRKLIYLLVGFENSDNQDIYHARTYSSLYALLLWDKIIYFPYGLLLPLAIVGMVVSWKRRRELAPLYLFLLGYIPTIILFLVTARHRLPLIPFLLLFAAAAIFAAGEWIKNKKWPRIAIPALLFTLLLIFCNRTYFDIGFRNVPQIHFNLALAYEQQGNLPLAEKEYKSALEKNPYSAMVLTNLGYVQYRLGKAAEALASYEKAVQVDPRYAEAYNNIGLLYESRSDYPKAEEFYKKAINIDPELYPGYLNLGDIFLAQNDFVKSELYYLQATQVAPARKEAFFKLGALLGRKQEYARAEEMFRKGQQFGEPGAADYVNWGNIYYATRQPSQAMDLYRKGIRKDTLFAQGYFNLAVIYHGLGYPPDSIRVHLEKVLRLNPNFAPARELLQRIGTL